MTVDEASPGQIARALDDAQVASKRWRESLISDRVALVTAFTEALESMKEEIAESLTMCMGRPSRFAGGEVDGTIDRARYMASIAEQSLTELQLPALRGFKRFIRREPLGTVLVLSPWNYPYLTAVNAASQPTSAAPSCLNTATRLQWPPSTLSAPLRPRPDRGVFQVLTHHEATAQVLVDTASIMSPSPARSRVAPPSLPHCLGGRDASASSEPGWSWEEMTPLTSARTRSSITQP